MPVMRIWEVVNGGAKNKSFKELRATGILEYWDGAGAFFAAVSNVYRPSANHESWIAVPKNFDTGEMAPTGVAEQLPGSNLPQRYHMNGLVGFEEKSAGKGKPSAPRRRPAGRKPARKGARKPGAARTPRRKG